MVTKQGLGLKLLPPPPLLFPTWKCRLFFSPSTTSSPLEISASRTLPGDPLQLFTPLGAGVLHQECI
ncbi:hypothetical protein FRX31_019516 [Thalictrum thalictroides]|uniref:Uncharacterized protein n=1 Tax=Thalictrum thalictroides TaxID=46969 RepID=A0A7J6W1R8_THATH|nr:hypothetical protein FRX31_019516 [Thalictrum thalictroides]